MMFTGGPTTVGPGLVVNRARNEDMRSHVDMQKNKAPHVKEASKFYQTLAEVRAPRHPEHPLRFERVTRAVLFSQRACANSHTIDVFACSLDQARRRAAPAREDARSRVISRGSEGVVRARGARLPPSASVPAPARRGTPRMTLPGNSILPGARAG